ncbi:histidine kinase dimerization/phosphoacceptor domain -containing protein [Methanobacterium alcaliphilum]|uniref:histidine kinase dimerization/phosphoacceptor domain -containing protein n=1 Tax=Methanobacterium alcaliphilum TaxID=392018 RepID=UPI00200A01A8|nr:histidine kinase dimerization/phosphoacceptor domain -containing protein [Methanobacterium alcaliphilum]MCK9151212.1 PAS domain S-box protein [Methanobacterium alcaliphilum]
MNTYALISLLAFMICFFLGNFIYHKNPQNALNRMIAVLCILVGFLAFIEFLYRQAPNYETAYFWLKISTLWPFVPSVLLHISLIFTSQKKILKHKITYLAIYLPAIIISAIALSTNLLLEGALHTYWGWTYGMPNDPLLFNIMSIWTILAGFSAGTLCFIYYLKSTNLKRLQAKYVFTGLYLPLIISIVSDLFLPSIELRVPEMTMVMSTIGIGAISYGIWKYRFPALTTAAVADKIVSTMSNFLLLLDQDGTILTINPATTDLLGYSKKDLIGQPIDLLFSDSKYYKNLFQQSDKNYHNNSINNMEAKLKTKNGGEIPVLLSISPIIDDYSNLIGLVCIGSNIKDIKKAEKEIQASLEEKEVLLREVHHRVKNNLQIISSLLNLQTGYIKNPEDAELFRESQRRVRSMALIHERLYKSSDISHVNLREYMSSLIGYLLQYYVVNPEKIKINLDVDEINLSMETAIPCGLIVNELVSNSLKYAFPPDRSGHVDVSLKRKGEFFILNVADNGIGFPAKYDFNESESESLGLKLVKGLVDQIDGEIKLNAQSGTDFKVLFKEAEYKNRIPIPNESKA